MIRPTRFPANANTPLLYGQVLDTDTGCEVVTKVEVHPATRIGLIVLIALAVMLTIGGALAGLSNPVFFVFALITLAFFMIIATSVRAQVRRDGAKLREFVDCVIAQVSTGSAR